MPDVTVALPVLEVDLAAPALSLTVDVTVGLPLLEMSLTFPSPWIGEQPPRDIVHAYLFARDGRTKLALLPNVAGITWQEELSAPGTATFQVPLDDATTASIIDRRVVKFIWYRSGIPHAKFGCRIRSESTQIAVDGRTWVRFENQPGLLDFEADAVVYPEYGLATSYSASRNFGYMSGTRSVWEVPGQFVAPRGVEWGTGSKTSNVHYKMPPEFRVDPTAEWISRTNPNTTQANRAANYFRRTFTNADAMDIQIVAAGDNYLDLYLDGQQLFNADYTRLNGWTTAQSTTLRILPGTHELAARVENGPIAKPPNPVAFICTVREMDATGKAVSIVARTNTTDWVCCDDSPPPGWPRAQVLKRLHDDAAFGRGVFGPAHVAVGFTFARDSAGHAWTDHGNYVIDVGTVSLVDVIAQLTEAEMDVTFDAWAMRIFAWKRAGADRRSTVHLKANSQDATAKSYETSVTHTRFTSVVTQLSSGEWIETKNNAAIAVVGRIEAGISLGSTVTDPAAIGVAQQQIDESSSPLVSITSQFSTLDGPQPYSDYQLGDTVTVPNARNTGTMAARVMAITVDATSDVIQAYPELVQDNS